MGGTRTRKPASLSATRTVHARRTVMRGGVLMSVPFKTSAKPFKPAIGLHGDAFGASPSMVNDTSRAMARSSAAASFSAVASMSAGSRRKTPMPYHPNAARNRLRQDFKRMPRPSETTMKLSSGVPAVARQAHPYMTTSRFAQRQVGKPVQNRLGFTNPGIMAEFARRSHKARLDA
ncbi:hypothetical protein FNF27_04098 [Cafeteria roenbergensis]|uniref:Uncharacterized protein n=1 Tax=Cafeteria roenbergensis TaxID=33653 RepID=A0A5A8EA82_CAFRO|nr:hypothetical protein FNF29_03284 [Cafeteria roenbergensis]KAA0153533.1 hypothetical protein FNF28_06926 [Cafeteria roenbergensis]KAA0159882.1 hypothetical protein FNF31_04683 [Cafeteria roenbergensis]KAA0174502.1 hypothetical protein FNF27_04098 [Cafeteria roenbergensis]|eukprot:KAA0153096.1 hypothetical protein FNF29_03284 [Cafeteria roenbergensis]